jgi:hypothetical protein
VFQTSWEAVYRSVEWLVQWGLAPRWTTAMKAVPNSFLGIAISVATSDETWMALPQQLFGRRSRICRSSPRRLHQNLSAR